jgi:outer membrane lipase/esterase
MDEYCHNKNNRNAPMLKSRLSATSCTFAIALTCASDSLAAPYSSLHVFGDSLSDAGYFADPDAPPGSRLRFTNRIGPTYQSGESFAPVAPMLLGQRLGIDAASLGPAVHADQPAGGNNHAIGGWRTDQILETITGTPDKPGYLSNGRRADPDALYYLTGGGNDFIQGRVLSQAQARAAADRLLASVSALEQAGARYIMVWMLPDLGMTPTTYPTNLGHLVTPLSDAFNRQLLGGLGKLDAQIIPLNVPGLFAEVLRNPVQFGLVPGDGAVGTCFNGEFCDENPQYGINSPTPDPSKLLFNDGAHPTIAGHQLIADYAGSLLAAPWEITLLAEMAHGSLRSHQDDLRSQWQTPWQAIGKWQVLLAASDQSIRHDAQSTSVQGKGRGQQLLLGTSYRPSEYWRLGVANGFEHQQLDAGGADSRYKMDSYMFSAFSQYRGNHAWADLTLTGGLTRFDSQRRFALGIQTRTEQGKTQGSALAAGGRLGFDLARADSAWHLSPFVSAHYGRTTVEGYREQGDRATALTFADQQRNSRRLGLGLQGTLPLAKRLSLHGEVSHEREFENRRQTLTIAQNNLPGLDFTLQGYQVPGSQNRASLGVRYQLAEDWSLHTAYSWQKSAGGVQQGAGAGLNITF